ncbi:DUF1016 domain-containing protein [Prevotella copri]|uniref:DUF1016 domain-containing protein n=1 Tax=Segatella copri TaxID=165179 RepID=A0AAW9T7Z0_9BACT|nr:hypothetical protein [Segatella copri]MQN27962.1 DUF1016 domain-containing protein [Segatella copri]MQN31812.1 DUF1016 domain-containing protein [Segatella copri]MQN38662.1 DUF1016 domain-containing protein [Segatella copri]MQN75654.1 DUF1016 domain-containing protein [Segatella copri]MQO27785.1 DUF1016 domain-containing protein [Segatella copri]
MAKENISLNVPQAADDFKMLFPIPWDHHRRSTLPTVQSDLAQQITKDPYQIIQGTDGNIRISTIQTLSERL